MGKFKMKIPTQTDNQKQRKNVATNENCILRKMGLKFQNLNFNPMQNSILEQAKVDHEIREISFSTRKKKKKPGFSLSLMCMFPESNETKF